MNDPRQLLTSALDFHRAGDVDQAEKLYRQALESEPDSVDALHLLGLLRHEQGDHGDAVALIARAVSLQPGAGALHNSLGVARLGGGEIDAAAEAFETAIRLAPTLAEAHRNLGLALRRLDRLDEAEARYQEAARLDPTSAENQVELGLLAEQRGDWWTAESSLRQALAGGLAAELRSRASVALARVLNLQDRSHEARELLEALVVEEETRLGQPSDHVYLQLGIALQFGIALGKCGEHAGAAEHLRRAVELDPESAAAHFNLSVSLLALGEADASLTHAQIANDQKATEPSQRHLAVALKAVGRFDEAAGLVQTLCDGRPDDPSLLEELAELESERGYSERAIELFQRALEIDPTRRRTLLRLAELCEAANQVDRTVETCVGMLKRDPNSVGAHLLLGLVLSSRLRPEHRAKLDLDERDELAERAFGHLQRAASIEPSAETFDAWGRALLNAGKHAEAIERLEQAIGLNPRFAVSYEHLGRGWLELGDLESAGDNFRQAVAIEPRSCDAHYELARLEGSESAAQAIDRLRELLGGRGLSSQQRMMFHFALARRLDAVGEYDAAFEHYLLANGEKKRPQGSRVEELVESTERMIDVFDEAYFAKHTGGGSESELPVLIVGMPRSGTTLVEQILSSHPKIFGAGELSDLSDLVNSLARRLVQSMSSFAPRTKRFDRGAIDDNESNAWSQQPTLRYPESATQIDSVLATGLADQYIGRLHQLIARSSRAGEPIERVTDKMPTNFRHLGFVARLLPSARIVQLRRDPLDICVSCFKQNLAWPFCDLHGVGVYFRQYERLMAHWKRALPLPIQEVEYERLVEDPEQEARRLVAFCGLPWHDDCLNFADSKRAVQTPSKWQVRQPVYKTSVRAWRRYERFLGPLFEGLE